jgi:hypothetical protein
MQDWGLLPRYGLNYALPLQQKFRLRTYDFLLIHLEVLLKRLAVLLNIL